ncbi:MAG: hypothetical protein WAK93_19920 [Solirubrobacteraceae bacterium]
MTTGAGGLLSRRRDEPPDEPLGVLLLPGELEGFELEAHVRGLLSIPRVLALEPSHRRVPRLLRDSASMRTAARLRFPGRPRMFVLYHPAQYPLARALCARYAEAELWYLRPVPLALGGARDADELDTFDELARERAARTLGVGRGEAAPDAALRSRLRELGVIDPHAFLPGARIDK